VKLAAPSLFARPDAAHWHLGGPIPAANYISIDAVSPKTVTRKTFLRYMVKSRRVNILLLGISRRVTVNPVAAPHAAPQLARKHASGALRICSSGCFSL